MIDTLFTWQFWAVFIPLMLVIWVKMRITQYHYYGLGATHGFALGISRTVQTLITTNMISTDKDTGRTLTQDEVIKLISPIITDELIKEVNRKALS